MSLSDLHNKRILILGFAREGISTLKYLRKHFGNINIAVADEKRLESLDSNAREILNLDKNLNLLLGLNGFNNLNNHYDVIFKSPGIPNKRLPRGLRPIITDQTQLFLEQCKGTVIGVTGTKGKSTTTTLIYEILKTAGKKVVLLGNIGIPPLDFLDNSNTHDTFFAFEMSSHQLSNVTHSPHIAVFLNFYPEHLDYYESIEDYLSAKANITKFQTKDDFLVFNQNDETVSKIAATSSAKLVPFRRENLKDLESMDDTKLVGEMNKMNALAAFEVAKILGISEEIFHKALQNFHPLEHRLENVGTFREITFYNDSIATIPEATIAALETLGDRVETLFIGGFDRGINYTKLAKFILNTKVHNLVLFPDTGKKIWEEINRLDHKALETYKSYETHSMKDAVQFALQVTSPGKIALLSPASTSFNLFKDYVDRGRQFKEWVVKLGKSP